MHPDGQMLRSVRVMLVLRQTVRVDGACCLQLSARQVISGWAGDAAVSRGGWTDQMEMVGASSLMAVLAQPWRPYVGAAEVA
jgi:hypothetical protein